MHISHDISYADEDPYHYNFFADSDCLLCHPAEDLPLTRSEGKVFSTAYILVNAFDFASQHSFFHLFEKCKKRAFENHISNLG